MRQLNENTARMAGIDLARYVALAGMMLVNFRLAMHPKELGPTWLEWIYQFLEGKASATFVVLAGLSLTIGSRSLETQTMFRWIANRALFLLIIGLFNFWIFPADILHYYAVYFLLALPLFRASSATLGIAIAGIVFASTWAQIYLDYGRQWNWNTLQYSGLWTIDGMVRNLFFNGFHPVFPWMGFFLCGMLLARLKLQIRQTQRMLIASGLLGVMSSIGFSWLLKDSTWSWLTHTSPIPPGPIYMLTGISISLLTIGCSLQAVEKWPHGHWRYLFPAGRMTLTIYLAHIIIGMGSLEALGALDGSYTLTQVTLVTTVFLFLATSLAYVWSFRAKQGPVEILMRRLTTDRMSKPPDQDR